MSDEKSSRDMTDDEYWHCLEMLSAWEVEKTCVTLRRELLTLQNTKPRDLCWYCKHLELDTGEQDWSEITVGYDGHIGCMKEHWRVNFRRNRQPDVFECMQKAATCSDFEARDETP